MIPYFQVSEAEEILQIVSKFETALRTFCLIPYFQASEAQEILQIVSKFETALRTFCLIPRIVYLQVCEAEGILNLTSVLRRRKFTANVFISVAYENIFHTDFLQIYFQCSRKLQVKVESFTFCISRVKFLQDITCAHEFPITYRGFFKTDQLQFLIFSSTVTLK